MESALTRSLMKDRLPFDIWVVIAGYLPVQSLLNLMLTSKDLHGVFGERVIWNLVFVDLLDIQPHHITLHGIHLLSAKQLRQRALRAAHMDTLLRQETLNPVITWVVDHQDTAKAVVVPQGSWVISLHEDGSIRVYASHRISGAPLLIVDRPDIPPEWTWSEGNHNIVISSVGDKYIVFAWECFSDDFGLKFVHYRVYHFDPSYAHPSLRLLKTIIRPDSDCDSGFRSGLLGTGWHDNGQYLLSIIKIPISEDDVEEEVIMEICAQLNDGYPTFKFLCTHLAVLSTSQQILLFSIPQLKPVVLGQPVYRLRAYPLARYGMGVYDDIWNRQCCHPQCRIASSAPVDPNEHDPGGHRDDMQLIIWPPEGQADDTFVRHRLWQYDMNPSRVVWIKNYTYTEQIVLKIGTHYIKSNDEPGYMRLGRSGAPDPSHVTSVTLSGQSGSIKDLSWCEQSGRMALLVQEDTSDDGKRKRLVMVDLLK